MTIRSQYGSQDLSAGEFNKDFNFGRSCKLVTVYVHASVPISEEVSIFYKSEKGSSFDTLIEEKVLSDNQDYVFAAEGSIAIDEKENINVTITNANTVGIVYVTAKAEY